MFKPYVMFFAVILAISACERSNPDVTATDTPPKIVEQGNELEPSAHVNQLLFKAGNNWLAIQQQRKQAHSDYLQQEQVAYRWFADFPMGIGDGVPYLILKILPELAPEFWGSKDNFLDVVGMFKDERIPNYPIARGFGWSGLARNNEQLNATVDYASFTCGACHIGRVKTGQGTRYLDGGVNSEFNLPQYRVRAMKTVEKITKKATTEQEKIAQATQAILAKIDQMHAQNENFFYQNYKLGDKTFSAVYEVNQIALFKKNAAKIVAGFITRTTLEYHAFGALINKNYHGFEPEMFTGFGGMVDATGLSTSFGYAVNKAQGKHVNLVTDLPPSQGITDFMAVWEQGKRKVRWSENQTKLIDGGGQWNGNIPIPLFQNMAAELTMGFGAKTDLRLAKFSQTFLESLPAPVYPFTVDIEKAQRGHVLFQQNCASCHAAHNGEVYRNIGTDLSRALIASETITKDARRLFTSICSPETVVDMPMQGNVKPCADFLGVSLAGKAELAMMDPTQHQGYNALPLGGIWAQAPYLHNGSVPTIYHLLVPQERPSRFVKSRLDYDQKLLGFVWQLQTNNQDLTNQSSPSDQSYIFDTTRIKAFSHHGHDKDINVDGKNYKLDWSDNKAGAMAIIEYMKTL